MKKFDKYQIIFLIILGVSILGSSIFNGLITNFTLENYDPQAGELLKEIPSYLLSIYTCFIFLTIFSLSWFLIRLFTFSLRKREFEFHK